MTGYVGACGPTCPNESALEAATAQCESALTDVRVLRARAEQAERERDEADAMLARYAESAYAGRPDIDGIERLSVPDSDVGRMVAWIRRMEIANRDGIDRELKTRDSYTARWIASERERDLAERRESGLREALERTGWSEKDGLCWCLRSQEETGLPHRDQCLAARAALASQPADHQPKEDHDARHDEGSGRLLLADDVQPGDEPPAVEARGLPGGSAGVGAVDGGDAGRELLLGAERAAGPAAVPGVGRGRWLSAVETEQVREMLESCLHGLSCGVRDGGACTCGLRAALAVLAVPAEEKP